MNDLIKPEMQEFINDFLLESKELIENVDNNLIILEKEPDNDECLNIIFRAIHTIKGTSSFMGLDKISDFSHEFENVLNKLRNKEIILNSQLMDVILESIDLMKLLIQDVENGFDSNINISETKTKLKTIVDDKPNSNLIDNNKHDNFTDKIHKNSINNYAYDHANNINEKDESEIIEKTRDENIKNSNLQDKKIGEILINEGLATKEDIEEALYKQTEQPKIGEILVQEGKITEEKLAEALQKQKKIEAKIETTMRVEVSRLDNLMNNVGELVLARNRLIQITKYIESILDDNKIVSKLSELANNFDILTTDIHTSLMKVRMIPINRVFSKFPRMVRDIAKSLNKEVDLIIYGEDTELDKSIAEELNDSLLHLIRNSIDHGIELPQERENKGKNPRGKVILSASQKSNHIIIEVEDDGKGIDTKKVIEKAIEKNLINQEEVELMTPKKIYQLIFLPGFSTAEKISEVSGRGVGMDVVKTNIEKLKGTIEIGSEVDKGTKIQLKIPVTLEIMQALIVKIYDQIFAIPLNYINNVIILKEKDIKTVKGKEVLKDKDHVLSLLRLNEIFNISADKTKDYCYSIILEYSEQKIGLIVTEIIGKEEIVIKPLNKAIQQSKYISGATILGDGSVSLVIDPIEIIKSILNK